MQKRYSRIPAGLFVFAVLAGVGYRYRAELAEVWPAIRSGTCHPATLLLSYLILPLVGFPIIPFLILVGVQFGHVFGTLLMLGIIPVHLAVSYPVSRSVFGKRIESFAKKRGMAVPELPENRRIIFAILFMAVPGLSYALKNYLLPLSGIPFFQYLICGWLIQGVWGLPFVILGHASARWSLPLFLGALGLLAVGLLFRKQIRKQYRRLTRTSGG